MSEVNWRRAYLRLLANFASSRIATGLEIVDMSPLEVNEIAFQNISGESESIPITGKDQSEGNIIIAFPMIKNTCYDLKKIEDFKSYIQDSINDVQSINVKINNSLLIYEVDRA